MDSLKLVIRRMSIYREVISRMINPNIENDYKNTGRYLRRLGSTSVRKFNRKQPIIMLMTI